MTDLPVDQRFTGGAWPAGITYTSNGGAATGTAPNSVQLLSDGGYAVPGTFTADSPGLFGGGAPGNYALVIAFPDGTFVCRPQLVAVS
jgi:hypothetical protein